MYYLRLLPFVIGFFVLSIGTWHSIRKAGEKRGTDKLPPNAYSEDGRDDY